MSTLRKSLIPIVELCGFGAAQELVRKFPSVRIYIPKSGSNAAVDQLSLETRLVICKFFGGETLDVPGSMFSDNESIRKAAIEMRSEGKTVREIALHLELSERRVFSLLKGIPKKKKVDARQLDLEDYLKV